MGRVQFAFNCIAIAGAVIHILAGMVAVYYLIPPSLVAHEEILSRKSRSLDDEIVVQIEDQMETSNQECLLANTCTECVAISKECIWYKATSSRKSGCQRLESESMFLLGNTLTVVYEEGVDNVSWGSCEVPLAVLCFAAISIAVIAMVLIAFCLVFAVCKPTQEEQMLIAVTQAAKKEKFLKRLGRLNPLPSNNQDMTSDNQRIKV